LIFVVQRINNSAKENETDKKVTYILASNPISGISTRKKEKNVIPEVKFNNYIDLSLNILKGIIV